MVICFLGVHKEPNITTSWLKSACPGERATSSTSSPSTSSLCWSSGTSVCVMWLPVHIIRCKLPTPFEHRLSPQGVADMVLTTHGQTCATTASDEAYYIKTKNSDPEGYQETEHFRHNVMSFGIRTVAP